MPMIRVSDELYPASMKDLRESNPLVSFPREPDEETLNAYGFATVHPAEKPEGNIVEEGPPEFVDGQWQESWSVREFTADEMAAHSEARQLELQEGILAERARRLATGFDYDFGDGRGIHHIGTTEADMRGWDEVSKGASAAMALGLSDSSIAIVTDTGPVTVTAAEWQQILLAATAARQPIYAASFALQAMDPIPADFADDSYWP